MKTIVCYSSLDILRYEIDREDLVSDNGVLITVNYDMHNIHKLSGLGYYNHIILTHSYCSMWEKHAFSNYISTFMSQTYSVITGSYRVLRDEFSPLEGLNNDIKKQIQEMCLSSLNIKQKPKQIIRTDRTNFLDFED